MMLAVVVPRLLKSKCQSVMMLAVVVSLSLLWSLVNSLTFPYVSFMGQTLANHSYVDLSLVGIPKNGGDSAQCHTDLTTCCSGGQGIHRGDWYFPNGTRLPYGPAAIHESREKKGVDLCRWSATSPTCIYYCDIATVAVHDNETTQLTRERVYVGLYTNGGGLQ